MRVAGQLLFCALIALILSTTAHAQSNRYAVIVAAEDYRNTAPVQFAKEDAELMRETFEKVFLIPPQNIQVHLNPTSTELEQLFGTEGQTGDIAGRITRPDAEVFVYFVGHGSKEVDPATNSMRGYLLGTDTNPNRLRETGYAYEQLLDQLAAMRDQVFPEGRVVLVMESCFSGRYSEGELVQGVSASPFGGDPQPLKELAAEKGVITISAASGNQTAYWDEAIQNSVFTRYLADGLFGQADREQDGRITFGELEAYLRDRVPARASAIEPSARQMPEISEADPNAVLVELPEGHRPISEKLEFVRRLEERRSRAAMSEDISTMSVSQLREKLEQVKARRSACGSDCMALLTFQQTIETRILDCRVERDLYRDLVGAGDLDGLRKELETSQCGETRQAAEACIASGSAQSPACLCLGEEGCAVQTAASPEAPAEPVETAEPEPATPAAANACADAKAHFDAAREIKSAEALQSHIDFYGACPYAPLAKALIAELARRPATGQDIEPDVDPAQQVAGIDPAEPDIVSPTDDLPTSASGEALAQCDRLAGDPDDPAKPADVAGVAEFVSAAAIQACRQAVEANPEEPRLLYQLGRALDENMRGEEAVVWYRKAADLGYAAAAAALGQAYEEGEGVEEDLAEAQRWYEQAARAGYAEAEENVAALSRRQADEPVDAAAENGLGEQYRDGSGVTQNDAEAVEHFRKAAEQGYALAQTNLGWMYEQGRGVPKDDAEAARWYRKAAEQNEPYGQANLATMYRDGRGVAQDDYEAVRLFRIAAEQGHAIAQTNLGWMYEQGRGVPKDDAEAVRWYRAAADQGEPYGQNNLGSMYRDGRGVAQDDAEAIRLYRLAAEQGLADARTNLAWMQENGRGGAQDQAAEGDVAALSQSQADEPSDAAAQFERGWAYHNGLGVPQDYAEAMSWYRRAAEQGYALAQTNIGWMYRDGLGVPQDHAEAARWYRMAAERGEVNAQSNLGWMYENGYGVPQDRQEAVRWYRLAAEQGDEYAQNNLSRLETQ